MSDIMEVVISGVVSTDLPADERFSTLGGRIRVQVRQTSSREDWRVISDVEASCRVYQVDYRADRFYFQTSWIPSSEGVWEIRAMCVDLAQTLPKLRILLFEC